jgi:hypothetical protein
MRWLLLLAAAWACGDDSAHDDRPSIVAGSAVLKGQLRSSFPWSADIVAGEDITKEEIDAFALPSGICLVRAIPQSYWFERSVIVIELVVVNGKWTVRQFRWGIQSDVAFADEHGTVIPWFAAPLGNVTVESVGVAGSASLKCAVRLEHEERNGSRYTVEGSFEVVPHTNVEELPYEITRFIVDTNLQVK